MNIKKLLDLNVNNVTKFDLKNIQLSEPKPFLVYVNPKAGAGKAKDIYYERILPVLSEANLPTKLVLTSNYFYFKKK